MRICFAPLEGATDAIFRRVHHACFGGVDRYYIPFISPTQNLVFSGRDLSAIAPENNVGVPVVPQLLTKDPEHFLWAANAFADMGYDEVNLNAGCPSGTVTAKLKGSGLLRDLDLLARLLDAVCARSPIPVSVKTRIGFLSPDEWPALLDLYNRYPIKELIVHPRTRMEYYAGQVHRDAFAYALQNAKMPLMYNGDLFTAADCHALMADFPQVSGLMVGRGLLANPALAQQAMGGEPLTLGALRSFHDQLLRACLDRYQESIAVGRMRELMNRTACCFADPAKPLKVIRKAKTLSAYLDGANELFERHALLEEPQFIPS